jgi:hypothetical protein
VNVYDESVAQRRYKRLIEKTIDIAKNHLPNNTYPGMVYLRLGDMISGEIHDDLRESGQLHAIPSVRSLVEAEMWGIRQLQKAFGKVHVVSVAGNHSRVTHKPQFKRVGDSFDHLIAWWLESLFKEDQRISFYTPDGPDALFELYGRSYVATHGDKIGSGGGQGFIGPAATIARGMKKVSDEYARLGVPIKGIFMGHFHTAMELELGWANGSMPGVGEYSRAFRMTPQEPIQWLIFFHEKFGPTSKWHLRLEEMER